MRGSGSTAKHYPGADEFSRAFADAPIGIALVSIGPEDAGRPLAVNRAMCEVFGYSERELLAIAPSRLSHPDDLDVGMPETKRMLEGGLERFTMVKRWQRKDGTTFWGRLHVALVHDGGRPRYVLTHMEDITSEHLATEALRESEERFRRFAETAEDSIFIYRLAPERGFEYVNPAAERFTGYTVEEHLGDPDLVLRMVHPDDLARLLDPRLSLDGPIEFRWRRRDGRLVWSEFRAAPIRDAEGQIVAVQGIARDITERREAEAELRRLAERDALTGLLNRRRFEEALSEHLERTRRYGGGFAVMLVDVDHFKAVNDSLGHSAGDDVLCGIAENLRRRLRASDVIARLGGDEFAALLPDAGETEAETLARDLLQRIPDDIRSVPITVSIGIASVDSARDVVEKEVLVAADSALYAAKEAGRNRVARFSGHRAAGFDWVQGIRAAVADRRFLLDAQPIVDVRTGETTGHELLVRMQDEDGTKIPPATFLPAAERFDLVRGIDRFVIEEALELAGRGHAVSVNLSGRSASDREMREWIAGTVSGAGVDPALITFEITETAAIATLSDAGELVQALLDLGCRVALDDFGTGFGSFAYLKRVPVSELKIDMEFVRGLDSSRVDRRIVAAIVDIAKAAGMLTVAEGVEDAETLERLRRYGVHRVQGFHVARPAPVEELMGEEPGPAGST